MVPQAPQGKMEAISHMIFKGIFITVGNQLPSTQLPSTKHGGGVER